MGAGSTKRNERLADAITRSGRTIIDLATALGVDPRSVDRWIADAERTPRAESRHGLAELLDTPAGVLWPNATIGPQIGSDLVALYPSRTAVPAGQITTLLGGAGRNIDVLALAGLWLWDAVPGFGQLLARRAADGVVVRVCLGDSTGASAALRGAEEGIPGMVGARSGMSLSYARHWLGQDSEAIRLHDTTLYASILRFDDDVLVNWHLYGAPAADSPVLHVRRTGIHGIAESALESFDRVWATSYPSTSTVAESREATG